jgi:cation diffusion facilitator CzcD-associated flavoprotein CzcO
VTVGPHESAAAVQQSDGSADVDVLIIGAGILGLYQLYRAREDAFSVRMLEAGGGLGGTWFWNRYPGARFDSESYTYAFLFSKELFEEWEWKEHFAGQPEIENYLNYAIDKFDLRRHIRFNARVTCAAWDESAARWTVQACDGTRIRARFVVAALGILSLPVYPEVPGRLDFRGETYHTGTWPKEPVTFEGKRVAVVGTGASGVQIIPEIVDLVDDLTVYQRTPNWCTPLNNRPITAEEQAALKAGFEHMREILATSLSGFLHVPSGLKTFDHTKQERQAFYERVWASIPGFAKLTSNYTDMMTNPAANAEWCEFIAGKIRGIVRDPDVADKLIPKDHGYAGKRPPFVTNYFETYNRPNISLADLTETPIVRVTETGIQTTAGHRQHDMIIWATGFDFGTGSLMKLGARGRGGLPLEEYWADGPVTFLGLMCRNFPNFFFPGGPHGAAGNNPRYGGDQSDFIADAMVHMRDRGYTTIEVPGVLEEAWTTMVDTGARSASFTERSYFYGTNVPGKARRYLINPMGRPKMLETMKEAVASGYQGFLR